MIGTGQSGDLSVIVKDETRKLARECSVLTPSMQRKAEKGVRRDIGSVFMQMPKDPLTGAKAQGDGVRWLSAGPHFLFGATDSQVLVGRASDSITAGGGIKSILYRAKGRLPKAKSTEVGTRGQQHVSLSNRFVIARSAMKSLYASIKARVGIRNASFAETAAKLGDTTIPQKTAKHFPTEKNITKVEEKPVSPAIEFGSNAHGVSGLTPIVQKALKSRAKKISHRINLILSGYAHDNNSGGNIRHHAKDSHES